MGALHARISGSLLLGVGILVAYWWCYKLAPSRRVLDPQWFTSHSQQEFWNEEQKSIHRGIWFHDEAWDVGMYGDKSWAEWIMDHSRGSMGCLGGRPCHGALAMRYISNQDVGDQADAWHAWWKKNRSKSQEEWIVDGFKWRGFMIDIPPARKQVVILLELLGNMETNKATVISNELKSLLSKITATARVG